MNKTPYIFPGVGVFLDRAKLDPVRKQDLLRLHGKSLDRISQHLSNAAQIAVRDPSSAREMLAHARKLLDVGPLAQQVAESMVSEVEQAVSPSGPKPVQAIAPKSKSKSD